MNKLEASPASLKLSPALSLQEPAERLIVLISNLEADISAITHKIWELANAMHAQVLFLGLYDDPSQEPRLRRELLTMSAVVRDGKISAQADIILGNNLLETVRTYFRAGDTVVCFAEQRAGLAGKPLTQIFQSDPSMPLYILSGFYRRTDSSSNWPSQLAAWVGSIAMILGMFLLQVQISNPIQDWTHTVLLLLSIPIEFWIIWVWNGLFD